MKRILFLSIIIFSTLLIGINSAYAYVSVKGYYRSNGTYVAPYVRSNPNGLKYDNYGYKPSQGLYNSSYGTKGAYWDTPTYVTDPNYYIGKSLYESGLNNSAYTQYTCPANSYLSGTSCNCNYGYVVSGGSCVSGTSYCSSKIGIMSSYNSLSKTCECMSGYKLNSYNQCVSQDTYCTDTFGYGTKYSYLKDSCVCRDGYEFNSITKRCSYTISTLGDYKYSPSSSALDDYKYSLSSSLLSNYKYYPANAKCPSNSYKYDENCYCKDGYELSLDKTTCIPKAKIDPLSCDDSHVLFNNQCITLDESCQKYFGINSIGVIGSKDIDNTNKCNCKIGYSFSKDMKSCVK